MSEEIVDIEKMIKIQIETSDLFVIKNLSTNKESYIDRDFQILYSDFQKVQILVVKLMEFIQKEEFSRLWDHFSELRTEIFVIKASIIFFLLIQFQKNILLVNLRTDFGRVHDLFEFDSVNNNLLFNELLDYLSELSLKSLPTVIFFIVQNFEQIIKRIFY